MLASSLVWMISFTNTLFSSCLIFLNICIVSESSLNTIIHILLVFEIDLMLFINFGWFLNVFGDRFNDILSIYLFLVWIYIWLNVRLKDSYGILYNVVHYRFSFMSPEVSLVWWLMRSGCFDQRHCLFPGDLTSKKLTSRSRFFSKLGRIFYVNLQFIYVANIFLFIFYFYLLCVISNKSILNVTDIQKVFIFLLLTYSG